VVQEDNLDEALQRLREEGLVAFATETVWGLAARAQSRVAVERLRAWKGRSADLPISILVDGSARLSTYHFVLSPLACSATEAFWPGPCTLVLACSELGAFAPGIARDDGAIGVRCSSHAGAARLVARAFACGLGPLTATSLNPHGQPAAESREQARAMIEAQAAGAPLCERPLLLEPGDHDASLGSASSVLDVSGTTPKLLREGALGKDRLAAWLASVSAVG
jgi:L-threonylcarbamoyladenylate synthase